MPKSLNQSLLGQLEGFFSVHNYVSVPLYQQFRKSHSGGFIATVISAGNAWPSFAELHLGIRVDLVEQLAYQFTSGLAEYGPHSTTLITSAGRVLGQPYFRYSLERPSDIAATVEQMKQFMDSEGFGFLEKYQRIDALDNLFNDEPHEKSPYLTNQSNRSLRGIILAKLAQREDWPQLVIGYRAQLTLRGTPGPMMQRYDRLTDYLINFSVN